MVSFFKPSTKVQKDRKLMRQADERTARFSRGATAAHLIIYLLSLTSGDFWLIAPNATIVLGITLALSVVWRASYLVNFDAIYSSGPRRWRNRYFISSLANLVVWSVINIYHITLLPDHTITALLLIYTTGMSASTIAVYSPYSKYLSWVLFISFVPAAIACGFTGLLSGYAFSLVLLAFFKLLNKKGRVLSDDFWQSREINLELSKRIESLEVEKQGKAAKVEFKNELLSKISYELRLPLNDISGSLSLIRDTEVDNRQQELLSLAETSTSKLLDLLDNVLDYSRIVSKELVINQQIFNVRNKLDDYVEELFQEANQHGIELLPVYAENFTDRVKGDAKRLGQVLQVVGSYAIQRSHSKELNLQLQTGMLPNNQQGLTVTFTSTVDDTSSPHLIKPSSDAEQEEAKTLGMTIVEGLLDCMHGRLDIDDYGYHQRWSFEVPLDTGQLDSGGFQRHPKIHDQRVYLVGYPDAIVESVKEAYEDWRLKIRISESLKEVIFELKNSTDATDTIVSQYLKPGESLEADAYDELLGQQDNLYIQVVLSNEQRGRSAKYHNKILSKERIYCLSKPLNQRKMHAGLVNMLFEPVPHNIEASSQSREQSKEYRLLLVEDHKVNQMVAKGMLNKLGYSVNIANNGLEAIGYLEQYDFDLIIMDCQMPEMDGYQATQKIREKEETCNLPRIPIIAMTAHGDETEEGKCLSMGMDDYLQKPVRIDDLDNRLSHWLKD